jgi:hypothetical protein
MQLTRLRICIPKNNNKSSKMNRVHRKRASTTRGVVPNIPKSYKEHKFVRTSSTWTGDELNTTSHLLISTAANQGFTCNGITGNDLAMFFSLAGTYLFIGGTNIQITSVPNFAEFTALYDQYRIDRVEVGFTFSNNVSTVSNPTTTLPILGVAIDYDDVVDTNYSSLQQYDSFQSFQLGSCGGKRVFRLSPTFTSSVYTNSGTGHARQRGFLDCAYPTVQHYGLKASLDPLYYSVGGTTVGILSIETKYFLTMAHTR